jgi:8-oxo-dGTP diphosphatase
MSPSMLITEPKVNLNLECTTKVVHVCVAVIERFNEVSNAKEILISKRLDYVHQGGLWEFPGGKVEHGETIIDALDRELFEELDIRIKPLTQSNIGTEAFRPLIQIQHAYPDKTVFLDVWRVQVVSGEPKGKEGQEILWVATNDLKKYDFPEANKPILKSCLLPNRYFITPVYASILEAEVGLKRALYAEAQLIYFRQPQLDSEEYLLWLEQLISKCPELESKLMFQFAEALDVFSGAGVHLSFSRSKEYRERPIRGDKWFAVSCHNESELGYSTQISADFITLSPVLKTKSHPDQTEMGWGKFKRLVLAASVPVYGLGGLTKENESQLMLSGAQGLAGIGFWQI